MNSQEIDEIIGNIATGDIQALNRLYEELEAPVFLMASTVTRNRHLAEDVLQDTFVAVYDKAPTYRPYGKGREWVLGIANNLSKQRLQKEHKYHLIPPEDEEALPPAPYFEDYVEQAIQARALLAVLSKKEQDIVLLHVLVGVRLNVVAEMLRLPLGSVYWSFSNARRKMGRYLQAQETPPSCAHQCTAPRTRTHTQ